MGDYRASQVDYEHLCDLTVGGRRDMMAVVMVAMGAVVVAFLSGSGVGGSKVVPASVWWWQCHGSVIEGVVTVVPVRW